MARKRFGMEFKGFTEWAERYERFGGNLKPVVDKMLNVAPEIINPRLEADIAKHRRSGSTARSIAKNQRVEWFGYVAKMPVGFKISEGGFPSIFLMYGTARHAPANQYGKASGTNNGMQADKKLYDDIYGPAVKRQINEKQKEIFAKAINDLDKKMRGV